MHCRLNFKCARQKAGTARPYHRGQRNNCEWRILVQAQIKHEYQLPARRIFLSQRKTAAQWKRLA